MAKIRLVKFGASFCSACKAMDRTKVFQRFKEKHPDVDVKIFDLPGPDEAAKIEALGDAEPDAALQPFLQAEEEADDYEVTHLPTMIFEDERGQELARGEEGMSLMMLEKLYNEALAAT